MPVIFSVRVVGPVTVNGTVMIPGLTDLTAALHAQTEAIVKQTAAIAANTDAIGALVKVLTPPVLASGKLFLNGKELTHMGFPVPDNAAQHLDAAWFDAEGNPVVPDSVTYELSDPTMGSVVADADATKGCTFTPSTEAGHLGDVTVSATAVQGSTSVVAQGVLTVTASALFSGTLTPTPPAPASAKKK